MLRSGLWALGLVCAAWLGAGLAGEQRGAASAKPEKESGKELISQAYKQTETAKSLSDFTAILQRCERAQRDELSPALQEYCQRLQAWAHNRRGELHVLEANALDKGGQRERAAKAEQLALKEFEQAVKLNPNYWKAHYNRGFQYAAAGKVEPALADFSRAIELEPKNGNSWFNRAEIYYDRGQFEEALRDYDQALELKPDDHHAYVGRAATRLRLQQHPEALSDYSRAVELAPDDAEVLAKRGDAYRSLGQWSRADADYRRALELDANSPHALQSAAWLLATCPEADYRQTERAVQYAEKAVELLARPNAQYLDTLAAAYANAGDFAAAKQKAQQALQLASPAKAPGLKKRLALYEQSNPYREEASSVRRPAASGN